MRSDCVAVHDLVGQRQAIRRDHQRDHDLQTIRPTIAAVATFGFWIVFHLAFKVGTRQVVQQHLEVGVKQIRPLLPEPDEQILFVRQEPVQASIQPILFGDGEIHAQQLVHRAVDEPLPVDAKLAARRIHRFTTSSRSTFSHGTSSRPAGKRACQKSSRPSLRHSSHANQQSPNARARQFQPAQLHLEATDRFCGISRSSGNKLNVWLLCSSSSKTSSVFSQAACWVSLISPSTPPSAGRSSPTPPDDSPPR